MKLKKVIKQSNLPNRIPIWNGITCYLALDHFNAPLWLYGAMGMLWFITALTISISKANQVEVDLLNNED